MELGPILGSIYNSPRLAAPISDSSEIEEIGFVAFGRFALDPHLEGSYHIHLRMTVICCQSCSMYVLNCTNFV